MSKAQKVAEQLYKQGAGQPGEDKKDDNDNNGNGPIDADIS